MNIKNKQVWLPLFLSVSLIIGMIFGYKLHENMGNFAPHFGKQININNQLNEILELIESKYVDPVSVESLKKNTIQNLINQLDPHSSYIPSDEVEGIKEELQGNYNGIGIQFELLDDTVNIISLFDKSPAQMAGLQVGDRILKVDTTVISGRKLSESFIKNTVRGKKGSTIVLTIQRNNQIQQLSIQRGQITSDNIDAAYFIEPGIGYIRIGKFSGNTYEEFMEQIERLKKEGLKKLILDLRDNGGGILDDAVQIADEFLDGNKEIVSVKGRNMPLEVYSARRPGQFETGELIVLINENSASASEVLAGALQDWKRCTVIGRRSFGKGLVQEQFSLSDGSAIRLTVARYYTPLGRSIQKPYESGTDSSYTEEVSKRIKDGELFNGRSIAHRGKVFVRADGVKLYSEEGISPDIFIPADSTLYQIKAQNIILQETLTKIALAFYKKHVKEIKSLREINQLSDLLSNDPAVVQSMKALRLSPGTKTAPEIQNILMNELEYIISWMIWKEEGYFKTANTDDPIIKKSLTLLKETAQ